MMRSIFLGTWVRMSLTNRGSGYRGTDTGSQLIVRGADALCAVWTTGSSHPSVTGGPDVGAMSELLRSHLRFVSDLRGILWANE